MELSAAGRFEHILNWNNKSYIVYLLGKVLLHFSTQRLEFCLNPFVESNPVNPDIHVGHNTCESIYAYVKPMNFLS